MASLNPPPPTPVPAPVPLPALPPPPQEFLRHTSKRPPRQRKLERYPAQHLVEGAPISATWAQPLLPRRRPHALARGVAAIPMAREDEGEGAPGGRERRGTSPGVTNGE
jgi:hypothetical protein